VLAAKRGRTVQRGINCRLRDKPYQGPHPRRLRIAAFLIICARDLPGSADQQAEQLINPWDFGRFQFLAKLCAAECFIGADYDKPQWDGSLDTHGFLESCSRNRIRT
jgi:hypothetical protein